MKTQCRRYCAKRAARILPPYYAAALALIALSVLLHFHPLPLFGSGVQAAIYGIVAVLIFMLIYYRWAGVNADIALILNLVILLGFMGYFGAVLTLPGIAGVILTVGMGVDSNVLIFERIREELRNGKTPPSAVEQGFSHAWITIVDTHVTTIVSAAILFLFGTGPVKGFATTLVFGLTANLFTAVFVSRVIFDWVLSRKQRGEALSI